VRAELSGQISPRGHGLRKLDTLSGDVGKAAVRRARSAGWMDALATLAGLLAALAAVIETRFAAPDPAHAGIAGSLMLLGFVAARLLETARALHARAGGRIALVRLGQLLADAPPASRAAPDHVARAALRAWAAGMRQRAMWVLRLPLSPLRLPAPPRSRAGQEPGA